MNRESISKGTLITLMGKSGIREYVIDSIVGKGAHCIVYDAHRNDALKRKVRIKEFYPANVSVVRKEGNLIWQNPSEKEAAWKVFTEAYEKQIFIQNSEEFGNTFTHIVDEICEANNTLYTIVDIDNGTTFDKDTNSRLEDILKTVLALAKVVNTYHINGYLHLDLKPENFMIIPETRDFVKLLDVDSILRKEDLLSGETQFVSYSYGWAAPEQIQGKRSKISERTDIYAIGAILFEKLIGRCPNNEDIGVYVEYHIPDEVVKDYDSRIRIALERFFRKTIAASAGRRFSSMKEVIQALENTIDICSTETFIMPKEATSDVFFVGREKELKELHETLQGNAKVIFIHGFGGIGKTELSKRYVQLYKDQYDVTVFNRYQEEKEKGLKKYIEEIDIKEKKDSENKEGNSIDENDRLDSKLRRIQQLSEERNPLFIVDNFDVDDDEILEKFLAINGKFIFTTRVDHSFMCSDEICQIDLDIMDFEDLMKLFIHEYGRNLTDEEYHVAGRIIESFDYYTMIVPLIAKSLKASEVSLNDFWNEIETQGLSELYENDEEVKHRKDGIISQNSLFGHMSNLFQLSDLAEKHKKVMANMADLKDVSHLTKVLYRKFTLTGNLTALNDMIDRGWIEKEYVFDYQTENDVLYISLHPIIQELVKKILVDKIYHQDILNYVSSQLNELLVQQEDEDVLDNLGDTLSLYLEVYEIDDQKNQHLEILWQFCRAQCLQGNLNIHKFVSNIHHLRLYMRSQFLIEIIWDYYRTLHKEETSEDFTAMIEYYQGIMFLWSLRLYDAYFVEDYPALSEEVFSFLLYNYRLMTTPLLESKSDNETDEASEDGSNSFTQIYVDYYTSMINVWLSYINHTALCAPPKWDLPSKDTELLDITKANSSAAEFYFEITRGVYGLYLYYLEEGHQDCCQEYYKLYSSMIQILLYYNGVLSDPDGFIPESINSYEALWTYEVELDGSDAINQGFWDNHRIRIEIRDNKKAWRKALGSSVWNTVCENQHAVQYYELLMSLSFLDKQPANVRSTLQKNNIGSLIMNANNLTEQEKLYLLVEMPFTQLQQLLAIKGRYKNTKTFSKRYSRILDIYYKCQIFMAPIFEAEIGSKMTEDRYRWYYTLLNIAIFKDIKEKTLAENILKEIIPCNIAFASKFLYLSQPVYQMGYHKYSKEIKLAIGSYWRKEYQDIYCDRIECFDFLVAMEEEARFLKDTKMLNEVILLEKDFSVEEKADYIKKGFGLKKSRRKVIIEIYWDILRYAADILTTGGLEKLKLSDDFNRYYSLAKELNEVTLSEKFGKLISWKFLYKLWRAVDETPYLSGFTLSSQEYFLDNCKKVECYTLRDGNEKYVGWGYVLLAELLFDTELAKEMFEINEVNRNHIQERDPEAYAYAMNYFNS